MYKVKFPALKGIAAPKGMAPVGYPVTKSRGKKPRHNEQPLLYPTPALKSDASEDVGRWQEPDI